MNKATFLIIAAVLTFFSLNYSFAQSKDYEMGLISFSLIMPESVDGISASNLSKLEAKILRMVTSYGISGTGYNANFVIYPKFEVYMDEEVTGMEKMIIVELSTSLYVKQLDNNKMFSSYEKTTKGIGPNRDQAIRNAIRKLPTKSNELAMFMQKSKEHIIEYYRIKCSDIILEADAYSKTKQYEKAIATLMTIPADVSGCFQEAQNKVIEYYVLYINQKCQELLQKARAAEAIRDYENALFYLSQIDPSSSCASNSLKLIKKIESEIDESERREWDFIIKKYNDEIYLRKLRIGAAVKIAESYYRRTQPTYNITYKSLF